MSHPVPTGPAPEPTEQEAKEELRANGQNPTPGVRLANRIRRVKEQVTSLQRPLFPFQSFLFGFFCKNNGNSGWSFLLQLLGSPEVGGLWLRRRVDRAGSGRRSLLRLDRVVYLAPGLVACALSA